MWQEVERVTENCFRRSLHGLTSEKPQIDLKMKVQTQIYAARLHLIFEGLKGVSQSCRIVKGNSRDVTTRDDETLCRCNNLRLDESFYETNTFQVVE